MCVRSCIGRIERNIGGSIDMWETDGASGEIEESYFLPIAIQSG
jgi:hypothetical protein